MKANELRIGNWVHYHVDGLKHSGDYQVHKIQEQEVAILFCYKKGADNGYWTWNMWGTTVQGIPLDESWLEKLGLHQFDKEDNCWAIGYKEEKYGYSCDFEVNINKDGTWHVEIYGITLKYVHHIQNAYYILEGKELEIKDLAKQD